MELDEMIIEESKALAFSQGAGVHQKILDMILSKPDNLLLQAMEMRCRRPSAGQALLEYLRALFLVLGPSARRRDSSRSAYLLLQLVLKLLDLIHGIKASAEKKILDCLDLITQELDALPTKSLPSVVELVLQNLANPNFATSSEADDGLTLQLLPRCLSLISSFHEQVEIVKQDGSTTFVVGFDYTNCIFRRLLSLTPWTKSVLLKIISMLRDMPVSESQLVEFLNTIFAQMKNVEKVDLPALVYQLLLLASKGSKGIILAGILSFFSRLFTTSNEVDKVHGNVKRFTPESLRQVEGTILLHINFAVKQNPALGQEIITLVKVRSLPLTSFIISVMLSIARIQRFEELALNLLKAAAVRLYQDKKQSRYSSCAPPGLKKQCLQDVSAMEQSFIRTVRNTAFGWDHVIPSLVSFGFLMIETVQTGDSCFDCFTKSSEIPDCKELGTVILRMTFEVHEMARDEIIEQSKCRIIGLKPDQISLIIRLLGLLVQNYPHLMLERVSRLKECLDYYTFLHPTAASSLISRIGALFQLSSELQGYAILVLRKAMFGKEVTARMTALQGLINLLIAERVSRVHNDCDSLLNSSSEASCSQQEKPLRRFPHLLQELKGLLRRCLLQQAKIREMLYEGLLKLVLADPTSAETAFTLLWPHFCRYFKENEGKNTPLDVECCVKVQNSTAFVEEPLDHLVSAIHYILTLQPLEEEGHDMSSDICLDFSLSQDQEMGRMSAAHSLRDAFLSLRTKLRCSSLSDLNLDKSQDLAPETIEGKVNLEKAHIYLGIYEVLIDATVSQMSKHQGGSGMDEAETDLHLYVSMHDALEQIVQKHLNGPVVKAKIEHSTQVGALGRSQSGLSQNSDSKVPFLSAANAVSLLHYVQKSDGHQLAQKNKPSTSQGNVQESVKQDVMSYKYRLACLAVKTCLRHVKAATSDTFSQADISGALSQLGGDWRLLGNPILEVLTAAVTVSSGVFSWSVEKKERDKQGKGRKAADETREGLVFSLIKCLDEILRLAQRKKCLMEVFGQTPKTLCQEDSMVNNSHQNLDSTSANEQLFVQNLLFDRMQPLLEQLLHRSQFREFEILSGATLYLASKLQQFQMKNLASWAESNLKTLKLTFNGAVKALTKMAICLQAPPDDLVLTQTFSQELLKVIGTDEQEPPEISETYRIINASTKNCLAGAILQHIEAILSDVEWLINKLKLQPMTKSQDLLSDLMPQCHSNASRLESEVSLHKRLEAIVMVLSYFVQMSLSGALAEQFLKVTTKLYKCLAATTKLCIAVKGFKQAVPSTKFQLLAEVTCKRLTASLYTFMAVMQRDQQENCATKGSLNKIKREVRTIPNLVFHVEDYERYLIQLGRLTKVNLMRHAKRSTARDFKILDNGKKCKPLASNERITEETAAAEESDKEADAHEEQRSGQEEDGSQEDNGSQNEDGEDDRTHAIRFRRPMEKRGRKAVVQDSDEELEEGT